jgi:hypothetical protein
MRREHRNRPRCYWNTFLGQFLLHQLFISFDATNSGFFRGLALFLRLLSESLWRCWRFINRWHLLIREIGRNYWILKSALTKLTKSFSKLLRGFHLFNY